MARIGDPRRLAILARVVSHVRHNVVGYLALFVALGGTSYAMTQLPKNSVGTKQLKKGAVTNRKLAKGAVTGSKVKNNSLTGTQINAATLGRVPSASHALGADNAIALGGAPASAYVKPPLAPSQFGTLPAVRAENSSDELIANLTVTSLTFNHNVYDNSGMHSTSTNSSRLTAPISGVYEITGGVDWEGNATGHRSLFIVKNGNPIEGETVVPVNSATVVTVQQVTAQAKLNAGDYVELQAVQNSGIDLAALSSSGTSPVFAMHWLGP